MPVGAHLLGRVHAPDGRDWQLSKFLAADPLDAALAAFLKKHYSNEAKTLAKLLVARVKGPTATDVLWDDTEPVLDQGDTGHCVGMGWAGWGDTAPVDDHYTTDDGHAIYYEAKIIDGEPDQENGSSVRSGAKAMKARGRLSAYAFATSIDDVRAWLAAHGPVVFGTDWHDAMFSPDVDGFVSPAGDIAGGHCYLCLGDEGGALTFLNSWGDGWGLHGRFRMTYLDAQSLLDADGEACAAVELP